MNALRVLTVAMTDLVGSTETVAPVGEVAEDDEGVHGLVVVEAARLCAAARGGQILATALVSALSGSRNDLAFAPAGMLELKGLPEPVAVVEVRWASERAASAIPAPLALAAMTATAFVGRADERARLAAAWGRAGRRAPDRADLARALAEECVATASALGMAHLESCARELLAQTAN